MNKKELSMSQLHIYLPCSYVTSALHLILWRNAKHSDMLLKGQLCCKSTKLDSSLVELHPCSILKIPKC